jgi:hypothetical protein
MPGGGMATTKRPDMVSRLGPGLLAPAGTDADLLARFLATLDAVRIRLALYEDLTNRRPRPFAWKFTRQDLMHWLQRAAPHLCAGSAA